jgi:hypothetical protein
MNSNFRPSNHKTVEIEHSLSKKGLNEFFTTHLKMRRYVAEDVRECPHLNRVVVRDCNMVLPALAGRQPHMTASLACDLASKFFERPGKFGARCPLAISFHQCVRVNRSSGDDFFADEMQPDDFWGLSFFKVAFYGIPYLGAQLLNRFRLSEDGMA